MAIHSSSERNVPVAGALPACGEKTESSARGPVAGALPACGEKTEPCVVSSRSSIPICLYLFSYI